MNGRVWGLKLSLFIKTDCICGLTYKALPKLDLFRQIIVPVWSLFYTKSCIDFIIWNWITELRYIVVCVFILYLIFEVGINIGFYTPASQV